MFTERVGRVTHGWRLAKKSLVVAREDGSLVTLTVLGAISACAIGLALLIPAVIADRDGQSGVAVVLGALAVYLATATGVFFAVALASCAADVLDGKDATVPGGIRVAFSRLHVILGWALVLPFVHLAIRLLTRRAPIGGILGAAADAAWSVATFLVIPILALDRLGPIEAVGHSASLLRQQWGGQIAGRAWIGGFFFLLGALPAGSLIALGVATGSEAIGIVLVVIGVLIGVAGLMLARTASAVFAVALYRYAKGEGATGPFGPDELQAAVVPKRASW